MTTTWTNKTKSSGTVWTVAPSNFDPYIPYDSSFSYDSSLSYDGAINIFTSVVKPSGTSWTNVSKAT